MPFNKPIKNKKIYDMGPKENTPLQKLMDQPEIVRMTVIIRLSSAQYVSTVRSSLAEALLDLEFEERGNVITVSAFPPRDNFNENNVLAIVQTHDQHAVMQ